MKNKTLDNSQEFREGIERMQRLLNIPSKTDDYTSVFQAISKIISEKLNASVIQDTISKINNSKNKDVIFL